MQVKKPTLTIGIPACNEEANIGNLLANIFSQSKKEYELKNIIIISDGSTDRTVEIASNFKKKYGKIKIVKKKNRQGKAHALNRIYDLSDSDFLFTIDADVLLAEKNDLDLLAKTMIENKSVNMCGPLHSPARSNKFFGNLSRYSFLIFRDAALKINDGNNFYSTMSCEFMRKSFYKSFRLPPKTVSDQCFAYAMSIKNGKEGFMLVKEAVVVFGIAQTFHDWRVLSVRSVVGDKSDAVKHFGKSILKDYTMSKKLYLESLVRYMFRNPVYATGSVAMNIYIRKFPYKGHKPKNGVWEMVNTSKVVTL